ncbi:MAG: hypothetical protein ACOZJX_02680 [Pseudomonadota bacterium]
MPCTPPDTGACNLRFVSLFNGGRSLTFPCDASGEVALDSLSERARDNYFLARARVGRDFAFPVIEPAGA